MKCRKFLTDGDWGDREEERVKIRMKVGWTVAKVNFGYMTGNLLLYPTVRAGDDIFGFPGSC